MSTMTDGLEKLSSGRLEGILERLTSNVFRGVLLGALVTGLIQSLSLIHILRSAAPKNTASRAIPQ